MLRSASIGFFARTPGSPRKLLARYGIATAARSLSRPQCRSGAAHYSDGAARGREGGVVIRCRHAAGFRSRLQARPGRACRRSAGHCSSGPLSGYDRADSFRPARPTPSCSPAFSRLGRRRGGGRSGAGPRSRPPWCSLKARRRLAESLADMAEVLGNRRAAVARELTKLHEEVRRGRLAELAEQLSHCRPAARRDSGRDRPARTSASRIRPRSTNGCDRRSPSSVFAMRSQRSPPETGSAAQRTLPSRSRDPARRSDERSRHAGGAAPAAGTAPRARRGMALPLALATARAGVSSPAVGAAPPARSTSWPAGQRARGHRGQVAK